MLLKKSLCVSAKEEGGGGDEGVVIAAGHMIDHWSGSVGTVEVLS